MILYSLPPWPGGSVPCVSCRVRLGSGCSKGVCSYCSPFRSNPAQCFLEREASGTDGTVLHASLFKKHFEAKLRNSRKADCLTLCRQVPVSAELFPVWLQHASWTEVRGAVLHGGSLPPTSWSPTACSLATTFPAAMMGTNLRRCTFIFCLFLP